MFKITKKSFITALSAVALAIPAMAAAQDRYPSKPITFIVPYAAGGSSDTRSRQLAQHMSDTLGVPVVVENRPGASGNIGTSQIARAKPDGYTIGLGNFAPMAINKSLYGDALPYDPENDIQPIALIERGGMVLAVNTQSPYQSAEELLKDAKANPDKLNYASTGAGGASHLISELFKQRAGFEAIHVPYRGGAPAVNDLMGGNVDMYLELASLFIPHLSAETPRIRALAISTEERIPALPNLPTFKELGIDLVGSNWFGVVAPAGIPADVLTTLNEAVNKALQNPEYRKVVESQGAEVAGGTPEEFKQFIESESALWGELIRKQGITVQ
ncbi:MAG TPA: tripartite tricarboxylate transporter substrate binding protein [Burkholderiaceae bacterium]|nr:tripartite tricarboxylate transporter substrate binding protein [Burkholderiaceae bacterium]